jgi:hypothetical protein
MTAPAGPTMEYWIGHLANSKRPHGVVVGGGRSFCGIWPNAEDWLPDWAVIRPPCPRCQTLMRSGSIRNVFAGKPNYVRGIACRAVPPRSPIKRYISGYVTGGLRENGVTRDSARVTPRNPTLHV